VIVKKKSMYLALLLEDNIEFADEMKRYLECHGFNVKTSETIEEFFTRLQSFDPDIILLDQFVSRQDSIFMLGVIRQRYSGPVIILTANPSETDRIVALETGADDFVSKTISPREVLARMRAAIRRSKETVATGRSLPETYSSATGYNVTLDPQSDAVVTAEGARVRLTNTEFRTLEYLVKRKGEIVSREELAENVLRRRLVCDDRSLDNIISRIRAALAGEVDTVALVRSVRGRGYVSGGFLPKTPKTTT
jgi:two-component system, OmpR family, response regulator